MTVCLRISTLPSSPKNILYFSSFGNLRWGGQKSLYHLVTRLDRQKYRPVVLLPSDEDFAQALRTQGVEALIYRLPPFGLLTSISCLSSIRYLLKLMDTRDISLMHTDGPRNSLYAGLVSWLRAIPVVFHVRSSDQDRYDRILYKCSDRIILVAGILKDRFDWVKANRKFSTIHNGVDLAQFEGGLSDSKNYAECFRQGTELMILCAGRIEARKGQMDLIEACAALKRASIPFRLVLAGEIAEEAYMAACLNRAEELKISDQIVFPGHIEQIFPVLFQSDIVVLPSPRSEAFSRAIIEAMAAGRPVVATDVGGAREAIEEGVSGFLVPPADPDVLGDRLLLLARDAAVRRQFGAAGRRRVEERFTIERNVRETEKVYAELLGSS